LDELPLSPNGKVDRKALPVPDGSRPELEKAYMPPRTRVEQTLVEIWREILKLERVGIHDNFFDLGGHSLLATKIISRVRDALKIDLPLRILFETPTIQGLAQNIQNGSDQRDVIQNARLPVARKPHIVQITR
jgi:acyl carrier protein